MGFSVPAFLMLFSSNTYYLYCLSFWMWTFFTSLTCMSKHFLPLWYLQLSFIWGCSLATTLTGQGSFLAGHLLTLLDVVVPRSQLPCPKVVYSTWLHLCGPFVPKYAYADIHTTVFQHFNRLYPNCQHPPDHHKSKI